MFFGWLFLCHCVTFAEGKILKRYSTKGILTDVKYKPALFNCASQVLHFFFQIEAKTLHQQKDYSSLCCDIALLWWKRACNISEVCLSLECLNSRRKGTWK